jgi:hypothetical protein
MVEAWGIDPLQDQLPSRIDDVPGLTRWDGRLESGNRAASHRDVAPRM